MVLPAGLHIKIDLQTGRKMARLMETQVGVRLPSEIRRDREDHFRRQAAVSATPTPALNFSK
jgi:hypothetical protein